MQTRGGGGGHYKWEMKKDSGIDRQIQLCITYPAYWNTVNIDMLSHEVSFLHLKEVNAYYRSYYSKKVTRKKPY